VPEEGEFVTARNLSNATLQPEALSWPSILPSGSDAPLRLIRPRRQVSEARVEALAFPAELDLNNIGRCLRWAVAIEGGTALLICAIWALLHL